MLVYRGKYINADDGVFVYGDKRLHNAQVSRASVIIKGQHPSL